MTVFTEGISFKCYVWLHCLFSSWPLPMSGTLVSFAVTGFSSKDLHQFRLSLHSASVCPPSKATKAGWVPTVSAITDCLWLEDRDLTCECRFSLF